MGEPETLPHCDRAVSDPEQFRREKWIGPFPSPKSALMEEKATVQQYNMYAINFSGLLLLLLQCLLVLLSCQ